MPPRSFLQILPLELVHKIIVEFCHGILEPPCATCCATVCDCVHGYSHPDISSLASLNRTCRRLHELTTARLYCLPTYSWLLVRTLLDRPDLGKLVKRLFVDDESKQVPEEIMGYIFEKESTRAATLGAEPLPIEAYIEDFKRALDEDDWVPPELMSSMCPNLEILETPDITVGSDIWTLLTTVSEGDETGSHSPTNNVFSMIHKMPEFQNLKVFNAWYWDTENGMSLGNFDWILKAAATSLQSVRLAKVDDCSVFIAPRIGPDGDAIDGRLVNVTRLRIDYSAMNADHFFQMLELFPNLQELRYEAGGATVGFEQFGPQHAADAVFRLLDLNTDSEGAGASGGALRGGMKYLKKFHLDLLYADCYDDAWSVAEAPVVERAFSDRGIQFSYVMF